MSESGASKQSFVQPDISSSARRKSLRSSGVTRPEATAWYLTLVALIRRIPSAPSWLVSLTLHLGLLLLLALLPLREAGRLAMTLTLGDSASDQFSLQDGAITEFLTSTESQSLSDISLAAESPLELVELNPIDMAEILKSDFQLPISSTPGKIASLLSGRTGESKAELLRKGGGTIETENAVQLGLQWLASHQRSDGGWNLKGRFSNPAITENRTAATAMALNAFLGAGYNHQSGEYAELIKRGLDFLVKRQAENGFFAGEEPPMQQAYAQAIATLTVLESYGLTNDYSLLEPARRATEYALWAQSDLGGWRYQPREDADTSVTGWFVMALETARQLGFEMDADYSQSVNRFLDSVSHRSDSAYSYNAMTPPDLTMTAEGILCRILLGWPRTHPALKRAVDELAANIPHQSDPLQSVYYWYYATQVMHHYGGNPWRAWNERMKKAIPADQERQGPEKGSWSPSRDAYGTAGGRLYTTCLNIYCLEVYYRHLAVYSSPQHDLP